MITINTDKILIPIDFSQTSMLAIKHGAFIAQLSKGELVLLHVQKRKYLTHILHPVKKFRQNLPFRRLLDDNLEMLAVYIRQKYGIVVRSLITLGNVTSEIAKVADKQKAGLIIMGTQGGDSASNNLFLGSNSYRVLSKSKIPVMTVRNSSPQYGYSNILLPIDSSSHTRQKVNSAIQIADKFASHIHVLGLLGKHENNYKNKLKIILSQIQKIAREKQLVATTEIDETTNKAEKTLNYGESVQADLIVIMADERAELSRLMHGTYAHQVIDNSKVPVLCIPPELHPENAESLRIGGMW